LPLKSHQKTVTGLRRVNPYPKLYPICPQNAYLSQISPF
jgi:hypothetical protein